MSRIQHAHTISKNHKYYQIDRFSHKKRLIPLKLTSTVLKIYKSNVCKCQNEEWLWIHCEYRCKLAQYKQNIHHVNKFLLATWRKCTYLSLVLHHHRPTSLQPYMQSRNIRKAQVQSIWAPRDQQRSDISGTSQHNTKQSSSRDPTPGKTDHFSRAVGREGRNAYHLRLFVYLHCYSPYSELFHFPQYEFVPVLYMEMLGREDVLLGQRRGLLIYRGSTGC